MRTKALLLTAAISAVGIASSLAQSAVYSVNAVGFVKLTIPTGLSIVANPLDNKAANGNTISNLFPAATSDGATVYTYDTNGFGGNQFQFGEWSNPNQVLVPGQGFFIDNPGAPFDIIFIGDVMQGSSLNNPIPAGLSIKSSQVPQAGQLDTDLGFPVAENDTIYQYNNTTKGYDSHLYQFGSWDTPPAVKVGEGFWVQADAGTNWVRNFTVSPTQ